MDSQKQADFSIFADRRKSLTKKVFHPIIKCVRRIEYAVESEFHDSAAYYEGVPDKIIVSDKIIRIFFVERNDEGKTIMTIQAIIYDKELFNSFLNTCGLQSHEELI